MLNIFYGDMKEAIYNTAAYFKYDYEDDWITDSFVKKMIKDVDQSIVLDSGVIDIQMTCTEIFWQNRLMKSW